MTETVKDGGQAFPTGDHAHGGHDGMTLRDWIAGKALSGMLAHSTRYRPRPGSPANWHEAITEEAYQIADAMLATRNPIALVDEAQSKETGK